MPTIEYRPQWGALPPKSLPGGYTSLDYTVAHYTAAGPGYIAVGDHERHRSNVRAIQRQHQAIAAQSDIEYATLVCACGVLFEGRLMDPLQRGGANGNAESNRTAPSLCFLTGVGDIPTLAMLESAQWWRGRVEARAGRPLEMVGHRDVYATSCPGEHIYDWVEAGGYRTPPPPEEDDMAPTLLEVTNHPGYDPRTKVVYLSDGRYMTVRWVRDEGQLADLRAGFAANGWNATPLHVDYTELGVFGVILGDKP